MAGCFGNSMFDRDMERQLFNHLDNEAHWDSYLETVSQLIDPDLWDSGLDNYFDGNEAQKILSDNFRNNDLSDMGIAELIEKSYTEHLINQDAKRQ